MSADVVLAFAITLGALFVASVGAVIRARRSARSSAASGRFARSLLLVLIPVALLVLAVVFIGIMIL